MSEGRFSWEFHYKGSVLLKATEDKIAHHQSRLAWWMGKKEEVLRAIREGGLEIDESLADPKLNVGYSRGAQLNIKPELQRDLQECSQKIRAHYDLVENYLGWADVLRSQSEKEFPLTHEDWMFFFSKK